MNNEELKFKCEQGLRLHADPVISQEHCGLCATYTAVLRLLDENEAMRVQLGVAMDGLDSFCKGAEPCNACAIRKHIHSLDKLGERT